MLSQIKKTVRNVISDPFFTIPLLLFILIVFINVIPGIHANTVQIEPESFPWNTQILMDSDEPPHASKNQIKKSDIRYGQKVRGICLQDDQVLFIFDADLDGESQLLVYNVLGEYLYGYKMYIGGRSTMRVALSPCYEGILMFDYKDRKQNRYPVIQLTPDGYYEEKWFADTDELGFASSAYIDCASDFEAINEDGKYVIRNRETLDITAVFDFAQGISN